jgi:RHS repeat-associated protein
MGKNSKYSLVAIVILLVSARAFAGPATGTPPYRSFGGGPDVINLGNLNVHYSFPVLGRTGRGIPFSYALAYDSSVWMPAGAWIPSSNSWGLTRDAAAGVGYVGYSGVQHQCIDRNDGSTVYFNVYTFSVYVDPTGTSHYFGLGINDSDGTCAGANNTATGTATDGSGMTMTVSATPNCSCSPTASVILRTGEKVVPALGTSATGGPQTDSNGNQITTTSVSGTTKFFDTLSSVTPVLTISGAVPNPVSYTYTAPSGVAASVVATYVNKNVQTNFGCPGINEYGPISNSLVDRITLPDGSYYQFTYEDTPGGPVGNVTGRLHSLRLPTGAIITYVYQGGDTGKGILCADGSTAGFDRTTPDGTWQYRRTGTSPAYTTTITTPVDPMTGQTNQTVIDFQGEFETQRRVYQGGVGGTPLGAVITCYNGNGVTNPSSCPTTAVTTPFSRITKFRQLNGGSYAELDTNYNGYGLVTENDEYDFGASTPTRKTSITYASLSNNILDHPASVIVTDGANNLKAKTTYGYDQTAVTATSGTPNHVAVTGSRGNLTTITTYVTSSATVSRTSTYYDTGTPNTSTDVNGAVTTYSYTGNSCGNSFVTSVSLPVTLTKSMTWNCTGGVMTSATDENQQVTSFNYTTDPYFWRPESAQDPQSNVTRLTYPSLVKSESDLDFNGTISTVDVLNQLDSLGRSQYTQQKQSQTATNYDTVQQIYDSFGRPYKATVPYVATSASPAPPPNTPATTTYYDALSRPIQMIDGGGGTVNITYSQNDMYQDITPAPTGEQTKRKQLQRDGLDRLTSVCEITTATGSGTCGQTNPYQGYWTKYTYDASGANPLTVTQNAQPGGTAQTRTYVYDMLGRLTSETNPETGQTQYFYDTAPGSPGTACPGTYNGDLVKKYDANGNTTCYTYDGLHRALSITYSGPNATSNKYFVFDTATVNGQTMSYAKGRMAEAYTTASCQTCTKITDLGFGYSQRGETTDVYEFTPHSGSPYYHVNSSYWANGALKVLNGGTNMLPGVPTITYGADGEGRTSTVSSSSGVNPVLSTSYNTFSQVTGVTFGSNDSAGFTYDTIGRMTQYKETINGTVMHGDLTWNANGSLKILAITDPFNASDSQTCNFLYDDLGRIGRPPGSSANSVDCGATKWQQYFTYDAYGNIKKFVPTGGTGTSFQPTYGNNNRYSGGLPGLSYDSNGNPLNDSFHVYTWGANGRPTAIDAIGLTYDALGRQVERTNGAGYVQYVYLGSTKLALMNGQTLTRAFIPLPGGTQGVYTTSFSKYRVPDWLGSFRIESTSSRTFGYSGGFAPFGERYSESGSATAKTFAGHNWDTVSDLYDATFREQHSGQGRWTSPDPAGLAAVSLEDPQTWNRYAYVTNDPLNAVDPLGLFWADVAPKPHYYYWSGLSLLSYSTERAYLQPYFAITPHEGIDLGVIPIYPQASAAFFSLNSIFDPGAYFNEYYRQLRQKEIDKANQVPTPDQNIQAIAKAFDAFPNACSFTGRLTLGAGRASVGGQYNTNNGFSTAGTAQMFQVPYGGISPIAGSLTTTSGGGPPTLNVRVGVPPLGLTVGTQGAGISSVGVSGRFGPLNYSVNAQISSFAQCHD